MATLTALSFPSPPPLLSSNLSLGGLVEAPSDTLTPSTAASSSATENIQAVYVAIGVLGVLGNALVLLVLGCSRGKIRPKLTTRYIANQSAIDLTASLVLAAGARVDSEALRGVGEGLGAELYCRLWVTKLFLWGLLVSSTYNLVAVTIERYTALVKPLWHHASFSKTKATVSMVLIWLFGIGFNGSYMIPTSYVANGTCVLYDRWPSNTSRDVFGVFIVFLQFFIPLGVIVCCYIHMAYTLRMRATAATKPRPSSKEIAELSSKGHKNKNLHLMGVGGTPSGSANNSPHSSREDLAEGGRPQQKWGKTIWGKARMNTIKTLGLVSACFVLCWIWNQVYFAMLNLGYVTDLSSPFYHFTVVAVFLNSCLNPFIYMLQFHQFQKAARKLVCLPFRNKDSPTTTSPHYTSSSV